MSILKKQPGFGALLDSRSPIEKEKDYLFAETVGVIAPVTWVERSKKTPRKFPIANQNGSGSCVAQTLAKLLGIMYWLKNNTFVNFSATHIYQRRANKPAYGMGSADVWKIGQQGVTLEELVPSQNMSDSQMDNIVIPQYKQDVGSIFKISNYLNDPIGDIDTIASIIQQTGKGVMTWFYFLIDEWTATPEIKYPGLLAYDPSPNLCRHSIAAVDYYLVNGVKTILIDDSWGTSYGKAGQREIDESFFKARNFYSGHPINFKFEEGVVPANLKYKFKKILKFSPIYFTDPDVVALQNILKYEGTFATNIGSTGYYGSITKKAVADLEAKYNLPGDGSVVDGRVLDFINNKYN